MGWTRHTGAWVSVALLASVAGHFAVRQHFESRRWRGDEIAQSLPFQADFALTAASQVGHVPREYLPPSLLPPDSLLATEGPPLSSVHRQASEFQRPVRVGQVVTAFQAGDEEGESAARAANQRRSGIREAADSPPRTVLAPQDATALTETPRSTKDSGLPSLPEANELEEERQPIGVDANAVRRVIEEELAGSSREERDIWYDELKSIPAGVVRDLLQVRKQLRSLPRALHKADAPVVVPAPIRVVQIPRPQGMLGVDEVSQTRRRPFPDWTPTMSAVEQAMTLARHNVANSLTPGFQRVRWQLVDAYGIDWSASAESDIEEVEGLSATSDSISAEGCRLAATLLDIQQGKLLKTGRSLDLAIDGGGFFQVAMNGKPAFTRCGAVVINAQRRLALTVAGESAEIQPPVTIPVEAQEIQITAQGEVFALETTGADARSIGRLQLARFACPERLKPLGATLLGATKGSGEPDLGEPETSGRGVLQQGCLEQSNVEVEVELADIERLQSLLKSLPTTSRPITADGSTENSR